MSGFQKLLAAYYARFRTVNLFADRDRCLANTYSRLNEPVVNLVLEVGQVTESVEVQANAALVETRSAGVGSVVENARILELPLNGRALIELASLSGAATPAPIP